MEINEQDLEDYERFLIVNSSTQIEVSKEDMDAFLPPDEDDIACPHCGDTNENNKRYSDKTGLAVCDSCNSAFEPGLIGQWLKPKKHNYPTSRQPTGPRPQAGRPSKLANPKRATIWLTAEQLAWVKSKGEQGEVIRRLIDCEAKKETQS